MRSRGQEETLLIYHHSYVKKEDKGKTVMAKQNYSAYQKDVISRYYENQETILLQNLQELVTELYLAESDAKKQKLWQRAHTAMTKLKIKPAIIEHIMSKASVEILAKNVAEWLKNTGTK
jgi:hypothetical protein